MTWYKYFVGRYKTVDLHKYLNDSKDRGIVFTGLRRVSIWMLLKTKLYGIPIASVWRENFWKSQPYCVWEWVASDWKSLEFAYVLNNNLIIQIEKRNGRREKRHNL